MDRVLIVSIILLLPLGAAPVNAQELPQWQLNMICAGEADRAACAAFESNAYSRVSGIWSTVSPELRQTCLASAESSQYQSYRLLNLCLEDEIKKARARARGENGFSG